LKPAGWGCWEVESPTIYIGDLFNSDNGTYCVDALYEDSIKALVFGTKTLRYSFLDLVQVSDAITRKRE
jgi:hypothetical protein